MSAFETEWEKPEFDSVPSLAENAVYLLPECNDVILRKTLQEVYRDFCKRSAALRTWRKVVPPHKEADGLFGRGHDFVSFGFAVTPVLSGEIDCVTQVCLVGPGWHRHVRDWRFACSSFMLYIPHLSEHDFFVGRFDANLVQHRVNVGTLPPEDGAEEPPRPMPVAVWVEAVEIPSLNEERAPKAFLRRYGDAIVDGALARLFSMSGRPWSDPEQARQRGLSYSNALSEARQRGMNGGPDANAGRGFALDLSSMV
jgi:hypothetical protein